MDLDDGERYAAAALFTLALHTTQVEAGVDEIGNRLDRFKSAWGCPDEELFDDLICVPEDEAWPGMEVPSGFWGFDCCAPQGLCRRVYHTLGIMETRWPGLIKMPDISNVANAHDAQVALVRLVRRYGALLDPAIAPLINRAWSVEWTDAGGEDGGAAPGTAAIAAADTVAAAGQGCRASQADALQRRPEEATEAAGDPTTAMTQQPEQQQVVVPLRTGESGAATTPSLVGTPAAAQPQSPVQPTGGVAAAPAATCFALPKTEEGSEVQADGSDDGSDATPRPGHFAAAAVATAAAAAAAAAAACGEAAAAGEGGSSRGTEAAKGAVATATACGEEGLRTGEVDERRENGAASSGGGGGLNGPDGLQCTGAAASSVSAVAAAAATGPHETTHQSVLALYELIGACLRASAVSIDGEGDGGDDRAPVASASARDQKEGAGGQAAAAAADTEARPDRSGSSTGTTEQQQQRRLGSGSTIGDGGGGGGGGGGEDGAGREKSSPFSLFGGRLLGSGKGAVTSSGDGGRAAAATAAVAAAAAGPIRVVRRPLVRWYDARARVALRRLCHWLHIPAPKMHAMEQMWALQLLQLPSDGGGFGLGMSSGGGAAASAATAARGGGSGRRYLTYLKISAGALGGAALLALTGGLAAPAIAAGLGSAVTVLGGSTAAATAVTTTLGGTAAGTAAITGTFGVIGASHAGSKAAALYGEVRDFGFWSILAPVILPPPPSAAAADDHEDGEGGDAAAATAATAASPGSSYTDHNGPSSSGGGGVATSSWSGLLGWRSKSSSKSDMTLSAGPSRDAASASAAAAASAGVGAPSLSGPLEQGQAQGAEEGQGRETAAPAPLPPPPPPQQQLSALAPMLPRPERRSEVQDQVSAAAGQGDAVGSVPLTAAPLPVLRQRPSKGTSGVSRDGLFIPADLLGEDCGEDGEHGVGRAFNAGKNGPLDPSHPAALFCHAPITPYPLPAEYDETSAGAVEAAAAMPAGPIAFALDPVPPAENRSSESAFAAAAVKAAVAAVATGSRSGRGGGAWSFGDTVRRVAAHPLDTGSNSSDGGCGPANDVSGSRTVSSPRQACDRAVPSHGPATSASTSTLFATLVPAATQCTGILAGGGERDGEDRNRDGDPSVEDLAMSDHAAAERAQIASRAGPKGSPSYVDALMADLDVEAADLNGDGGGGRAAAVATATAASDANAATGSSSSRRSWFRSNSKQTGTTGGGSGGSGRGGATAAAAAVAASGKAWGRGGKGRGNQLRPLLPVPVNPRHSGDATLALTIAVNGWVKQPEDFVDPWRQLPSSGRELWALVWERDVLTSLGGALRRFIRDKAIEESSKMVLRLGVSAALVAAMVLPMAVMSAINLTIGSRWRVALRRAQLGGQCLAHLLMQGAHGDRPVTLIGFSIGARLIFHCLLELSRCGGRGLVESAVLLGTPVSAGNEDRWKQARSVVSGRLVNAFSNNDWVLGVIFRAHSKNSLMGLSRGSAGSGGGGDGDIGGGVGGGCGGGGGVGVAGLGPVVVAGVENINLSALIGGHTQYLEKLEDVLSAINLVEY